MFFGLFGSRSAKITKLEFKLEAQQTLIQSQGQLINLQVEKIDSQLEELKALQANIASLHQTAFEQTLTKLNNGATADLVNKVKHNITADPSFATEVASDMHEAVREHLSENLDYDDLLRHVEIDPSDVADNLANNIDMDDLTERLHRQLDFDDIASRVEVDMNEFSYAEVASEIDLYDLAQEVSIDYDEISHNLDYSDIEIDYEAISARVDLEQMSLDGLVAKLPQLILDVTTDRRAEAEGDWTELEWSILMVVRKAIAELAQDADQDADQDAEVDAEVDAVTH